MSAGLLVAVLITIAWVLVQVGVMHVRPARNRSGAMTVGYLASLPLVGLAYAALADVAPFSSFDAGETWWLGFCQAYIAHLLLYVLYVQCFYHVERSVTLRLLIEIRDHAPGRSLEDLQRGYSLDAMITSRLVVLAANRFITQENGQWQLLTKGRVLAIGMLVSTAMFRSKPQSERDV